MQSFSSSWRALKFGALIPTIVTLFVCWAPLNAQSKPEPIGIVDRAKGRWIRPQDRDRKALNQGDLILPGQTIATDYSESNSLGIVIFATGKLWQQDCTPQAPCEGSYRPPTPASEVGGFWAFLSGYRRSEVKIPAIFAGSRSAGLAGPRHALLPASGSVVNLKPALADVPPGQYRVALTPQGGADLAKQESKKAFAIRWDGRASVEIATVPSGLYSLQLLAENGEDVGSPAAILIVRDNVAHAEEIWEQVRTKSAQWNGADPGTVNRLLLATLCALWSETDHS